MTLVHGVNGRNVVETYLVNVGLPNRILFTDVKVTKGVLQGGGDGDLLIGMDIIGMGDFAVSSKGGNTVFTFRFPSIADIDFVKEHDARLQAEALRGSHSRKSKKKAGKQFGRSK